MKRLYIFILSLVTVAGLSAQVADDPVLMTVNGKEILRSEFEYAFNKNRGNIADSAMTAEEYLQMYIDFKLKVVEAEALGLECNLIKKYRPKYNILLKDDKTYPYIKVHTKEDYPRISITRKVKKDGKYNFHLFFPSIVYLVFSESSYALEELVV